MHFDATVSLGNVLALVALLVTGFTAWRAWKSSEKAGAVAQRDLDWRIANLETWRKEHMIDSDARDTLMDKQNEMMVKFDKVLDRLNFLVQNQPAAQPWNGVERRRRPRPGGQPDGF